MFWTLRTALVTCDFDDPLVVADLVLRPAGEVGQLPVAQLPDDQLVQPTSLPKQVHRCKGVKVYRCKELNQKLSQQWWVPTV